MFINLDKQLPIAALYMDILKAFDHVKLNIILEKLSAYEIIGNVLDIMRCYFKDIKQPLLKLCPISKIIKTYGFKHMKINWGYPKGVFRVPVVFNIYKWLARKNRKFINIIRRWYHDTP